MHTNFFPLPRRPVSAHSYVVESFCDKKAQPTAEETYLNPTSIFPIRLHQACLMTQETVQLYFKKNKFLFGRDSDHLNRQRISLRSKWVSSQLVHLVDKAATVTGKVLVQFIEEYGRHDDLQVCWKNLKENFSQFYLKLMKDREMRNKVENKT